MMSLLCIEISLIGHFTVMGGSESEVDLVLLYNVNQFILMVTSIFQGQFP